MEAQQGIWSEMGWNRSEDLWYHTSNAKFSPGRSPVDVRIPDFAIFLQQDIPYFVTEIATTQELQDAINRTETAIKTYDSCQGGMVVKMVEDRTGPVFPAKAASEVPTSGQELEANTEQFSREAGVWLDNCLKMVHRDGSDDVFQPLWFGGHCWVGSITVTCYLFQKVGNNIERTETVSISSSAETLSQSKQK
jgi:hypothetical protein